MDINNFRVSPDGKYLELWVEVPDGYNYENLEIDEIAIVNHKGYSGENYPQNNAIRLNYSTASTLTSFEFNDRKRVITRIPFSELKLGGVNNTGLFFVYIKRRGLPNIETPCECDKEITIGVAANLYPIYNKTIKLLNTFDDRCKDNKENLIDIYLKKQMFLEAIVLQEYTTAIEIFDSLLFMEIKEGDCLNGCNPSFSTTGMHFKKGGCNNC